MSTIRNFKQNLKILSCSMKSSVRVGVLVEGKGDSEADGEAYNFCIEHVNKKLKQNLGWALTAVAWALAHCLQDLSVFRNYEHLHE